MFKRIRQWLEGLRWVGDAFYWIRAHTYTRYHLINISGQDGYTWGWIDRDRAIMLACFKLLCDYVEKESHHIDWEGDQEHKECKATMDYLYNWWKVERPRKLKEIEDFCENNPGEPLESQFIKDETSGGTFWTLKTMSAKDREIQDKFNQMDDALEREEDENLVKLMKIRRALWS